MLRTLLCGGLACTVLASAASSQSRFATSVVSYNQGGGGGIFDPLNILGAPQGGGLFNGSLDVLSLGIGGDVTLGFDVTLTDGPGADFTVSENPFVLIGSQSIFAEYAFVEVSTNGTDFARFPAQTLPGGSTWGSAPGFAGGTPGIANALTNTVDPFDPVVSGGDSFDLAELVGDPLVTGGLVDLSQIHFVRLVDNGSADIDAVAVIQHTGNQVAGAPTCDLWRDSQGFLHLRIADPDGLADIDFTQLRMSVNLVEVPFNRLRNFMVLQSISPTNWELVSPAPVGNFGFQSLLSLSVRDWAGNFSGDQISLHP